MKSIFINHTIDEFLACIFYLTDEERLLVTDIYYATSDEVYIRNIINFIFPNIKNQSIVVPKLNIKTKVDRKSVNVAILNLLDFDVETFKHESSQFTRMFNRFKFPKLADVKIPHYKYAVITSESFNSGDELSCIEFLQNRNLIGIVVNDTKFFKSHHETIIDYTSQFTLLQKIELLKLASCFYGDSSTISIIASKLYRSQDLYIEKLDDEKSKNPRFYYSPKEWPILHEKIETEHYDSEIPRIF